ncbi:relaxase/mobilization nuclease domain-containing protein [Clostridioides difficile]
MAVTKTHPIKTTLNKAIAYICNPEKTDGMLLVSTFGCSAEAADIEFSWTRRHAIDKGTNLGRHLIQAFEPGETTPEQAHEIGMKLANEVLGGKYEFVLTTHIDKGHIHNHIIFNAVSFVDYRKYHSNKRSYHDIRRTSDQLCKEYGLSVITPGQDKGKSYIEHTTEKTGTSYKAKLKAVIDRLILQLSTFEELIKRLEAEGYEIKRRKYISCRATGQERFTRLKTLGVDYTEEVVAARISGALRPSRQPKAAEKKINLLIDIQNNLKVQESAGFAHWAKINNLKQAAKTLNFLTEHGITHYEQLQGKLDEVVAAHDRLLSSIKEKEQRIADIGLLIKHTAAYREYKPIYEQYKKSSDKEKFLRGQESKIILFEAAARALKQMGVQKLPDTAALQAERDTLTEEKQKQYGEYQKIQNQAKEMDTIKRNVDSLLSIPKQKEKAHIEQRE